MKIFGEAFNTFANRADPDQEALLCLLMVI